MAEQRVKKFKYGMRLRGFSIGAQPMDGFMSREDDPSGKYYDIITYSRRLTAEEVSDYELDDLNRSGKKRLTIIREEKGIKQKTLANDLGISIRTVQGWELNGMSKAPLDRGIAVAEYLGVTVNDLIEPEN